MPFSRDGTADASFDMFFALTLRQRGSLDPAEQTELTLHPETAFNLTGPIVAKPPVGGANFDPNGEVRIALVDSAGAPSGWYLTRPSIAVGATTGPTPALECFQ